MAELKTKANEASVQEFLESVTDDQRRTDCLAVMKLLAKITDAEAKMWGANIIGFGTFRLRYPDGREIDWMQVGLSPRKQNLTVYIHGAYVQGGLDTQEQLLQGLGKFKTGKGCLYIKKLEDIDMTSLEKLITTSIDGLNT
jgi:nucleoid DNA-binding protein